MWNPYNARHPSPYRTKHASGPHSDVASDSYQQHIATASTLSNACNAIILRMQPCEHRADEPLSCCILRTQVCSLRITDLGLLQGLSGFVFRRLAFRFAAGTSASAIQNAGSGDNRKFPFQIAWQEQVSWNTLQSMTENLGLVQRLMSELRRVTARITFSLILAVRRRDEGKHCHYEGTLEDPCVSTHRCLDAYCEPPTGSIFPDVLWLEFWFRQKLCGALGPSVLIGLLREFA